MSNQKPLINIRQIKRLTGLEFRSNKWLASALLHPSYRNENSVPHLPDFNRLEFFGDAILNYVICKQLYTVFPDADEGTLSRLRSILVSKKMLSRIAKKLKLKTLLRLGRSILRDHNAVQPKIFTDAFESLIGAYYFDRGLTKTESFILQTFDGYFDNKKLLRIDPNPKSTLQELSQKYWRILPVYRNEAAPSGFKSTVAIISKFKSTGEARTRFAAEEKAARQLIRKIRQEFPGTSKKKSSGKKFVRASRGSSAKRRSVKAGHKAGSI
jgi:ribonuclease III